MLIFDLDETLAEPGSVQVQEAYLIGADTHPVRSEIVLRARQVVCDKREAGTAALMLQHRCGKMGRLTIQTCLLPERDEPYLLTLELARHRLMVLYSRLEEWSMFDLDASHAATRLADEARSLFIQALCLRREDPEQASRVAQRCLEAGLDGSEELALAHSELFLGRRREMRAVPRHVLGVGVDPGQMDTDLQAAAANHFDFLQLPMPWRNLCPVEDTYRWEAVDAWIDWAKRHEKPVLAGPIINFTPQEVPDWLYIWEHDYDTLRETIYEHVERVVQRLKGAVPVWNVVSGLHINNHLTFSFEQLMDLTRMIVMLVKKLQPVSRVMVELREPFGAYFAGNQRSIPPLTYVDLMVQSGIQFDALSLRVAMGQAVAGFQTRDLMQYSSLLEQFGVFGKPLHVSLSAPSHPVTSVMIADPHRDEPVSAGSGFWRNPWSPSMQSHWLEAACQIALSKPYVESLSWQNLVDFQKIELPMSGLMGEDRLAKPALRRIRDFRASLRGQAGADAAHGGRDRARDTPAAVEAGGMPDVPDASDAVEPAA